MRSICRAVSTMVSRLLRQMLRMRRLLDGVLKHGPLFLPDGVLALGAHFGECVFREEETLLVEGLGAPDRIDPDRPIRIEGDVLPTQDLAEFLVRVTAVEGEDRRALPAHGGR